MSLVFNLADSSGNSSEGSGGGLRADDAVLRVIAPTGSTVTISRDGVSKSADGRASAADQTFAMYLFAIHPAAFSSSPWTVTATLGQHIATATIVINATLDYVLQLTPVYYLYNAGAANVTLVWSVQQNAQIILEPTEISFVQLSESYTGFSLCSDEILDVTNYSTLCVVCNFSSTSSQFPLHVGFKSPTESDYFVYNRGFIVQQSFSSPPSGVISVDISSISSGRLAIDGAQTVGTISAIYLEP